MIVKTLMYHNLEEFISFSFVHTHTHAHTHTVRLKTTPKRSDGKKGGKPNINIELSTGAVENPNKKKKVNIIPAPSTSAAAGRSSQESGELLEHELSVLEDHQLSSGGTI